jgi:geranylgeranyl diphosphate synthase type II
VLSHAFAHAAPSERSQLEDFLSHPGQRPLERQLVGIYDLLHSRGSIQWARRASSDLTAAAEKELPVAYADAREGPDLDFVRALVGYLVERDV